MTTTIHATQDTYTDSGAPNDNFDGDNLFVYHGIQDSYVGFDLSSFAGEVIHEALIKLYIVANDLTSDTHIRFHRIDQSWDASEVTWNDPPHITTHNAKNKTLEHTDINWRQWNITDLVQDIIDNGGYGVKIEIDASEQVEFASIDMNYSNRPKLVITTCPDPICSFKIN